MKIGIDAGGLGITDERLKVGVYHIVKDVLQDLGKLDKKNTYLLYSFKPIDKLLLKSFGENMRNIVVGPMRGWLKIGLPFQLLKDKPDIFIGANQALPQRVPFLSSYKTISIFYDIAFETLPQLYVYAGDLNKLRRNSRTAAIESDVIISISQTTKEDVSRFYHISKKKIVVAYPPISIDTSAGAKKLSNKYFLYVGAFKKSKNIPTILRAFNTFISTIKNPYNLILIGGDKWLDPEIKITMNNLSPKTRSLVKIIRATGNKTELSKYYKGALAFLSPSLYEGFGLPIAEAMILGTPVIASKEGSIPEVVGNAGILVEATSSSALSQAMLKVAMSISLQKNMRQKGKEQAKKFKSNALAKTIYSIMHQYENPS